MTVMPSAPDRMRNRPAAHNTALPLPRPIGRKKKKQTKKEKHHRDVTADSSAGSLPRWPCQPISVCLLRPLSRQPIHPPAQLLENNSPTGSPHVGRQGLGRSRAASCRLHPLLGSSGLHRVRGCMCIVYTPHLSLAPLGRNCQQYASSLRLAACIMHPPQSSRRPSYHLPLKCPDSLPLQTYLLGIYAVLLGNAMALYSRMRAECDSPPPAKASTLSVVTSVTFSSLNHHHFPSSLPLSPVSGSTGAAFLT